MNAPNQTNAPRRVLSGMRPTGKLHLGNYMGALRNWVELQGQTVDGQPKYAGYYFIADLHALTTDYADPSGIRKNIQDVAMDFLAAGLDPEKSTIFVQSDVPQHAELFALFSMFTPLSWLERVPTYKDQQEQLKEKDLATYGFLGYPLLMAADILLYRPDFVPVGQDQEAHVEITREISRRFNGLYGRDSFNKIPEHAVHDFILPEPQPLLTPSPKLPGLDGRKMSKSYNNTILLSDPAIFVGEKVFKMTNGGQRALQSEPGNPDICPVGDMHKLFSSPDVDVDIRTGCRNASITCRECKALAAISINQQLWPIQQRRRELEENPERIEAALKTGAEKARDAAEETMKIVRRVMGLERTVLAARTSNYGAVEAPHSLAEQQDWWSETPLLRGKHLREYWLERIVPGDIQLKRIDDRVFVNAKNRRVFVRTAQQKNPSVSRWRFDSKPKSYEVIVLLCWQSDFTLQDFVIPQKIYVEEWSRIKKQNKNGSIEFEVWRESDQFFLELGAQRIDITAMRGDYAPLR